MAGVLRVGTFCAKDLDGFVDNSYPPESAAVHEDRSTRFGRRMLAVFESRKEMPVPVVQLNCLYS